MKFRNMRESDPVSFRGDSQVYHLSYSPNKGIIKKCPQNCALDHDCYEEDYICVYKVTGTAMPLSKLKTWYNHNGIGEKIVK